MTAQGDRFDMNAALTAMWEKYRPLNRSRFEVLVQVNTALQAGSLTPELRAEGEREAHKISGAAGSFGFVEITEVARSMETQLHPEAGSPDIRRFQDDLERLRNLFGF
jgi:HPt (histidine-containing phosphotransfer) domain-containing protein